MVDYFKIAGQPSQIDARDMIYSRMFDAASIARACGCLESAWRAYRLDMEREDYQGEQLINLKVPSVVIRDRDNMWDAEQRKEIKAQFGDSFGKGHRAEPAIVGGQGDIEILI